VSREKKRTFGSEVSEQFPPSSPRSSVVLKPSEDPLCSHDMNMKGPMQNISNCIPKKRGQLNMVVGEELVFVGIENFHGKLLLGRFIGKTLGLQALQS
jgi:hypothetical protein